MIMDAGLLASILGTRQYVYPTAAYAGGADSNWRYSSLLIDFPYYHSVGVVPGDTVWDMTGQHQFTIPVGSTLDATGWTRGVGGAITIPASSTFDQNPNQYTDVVFNMNGDTSADSANLIGAWGTNLNWVLRRASADTLGLKQQASATEYTLAVVNGSSAWHHVEYEYTDKQRLYLTAAPYLVCNTNVAYRANAEPVTLASRATYRLVRIGRGGRGVLNRPSETGDPVPIPDYSTANNHGGSIFDPTTGLWTPKSGTPAHVLDPIFAAGEHGLVFDPTRLDTMWQDSARTIPVTTTGDRVRVWEDARGSGYRFESISDALRPTWNDGVALAGVLGGAVTPHLKFTTANSMDLMGAVCTHMNFAQPTVFARVEATSGGGTVMIGWPHASSHTSPYFRTVLYSSSGTLSVRVNGTAVNSLGSLGAGQYPMLGVDPAGGLSYNDGTTSITSAAVTSYPNPRGILINCNASGGEKGNNNFFGICFFDRASTPTDRALLDSWNDPR